MPVLCNLHIRTVLWSPSSGSETALPLVNIKSCVDIDFNRTFWRTWPRLFLAFKWLLFLPPVICCDLRVLLSTLHFCRPAECILHAWIDAAPTKCTKLQWVWVLFFCIRLCLVEWILLDEATSGPGSYRPACGASNGPEALYRSPALESVTREQW
jgi:hypothetical protein